MWVIDPGINFAFNIAVRPLQMQTRLY